MSIRSIPILLFMFLGLFSCKKTNTINDGIVKLIENSLTVPEANPTHADMSGRINDIFGMALTNRKKLKAVESDSLKTIINSLLTQNREIVYEDEPDMRRMVVRRAMCFCALAFLSRPEKAEHLITLAKLEFGDSEFIANQELLWTEYLAVMWSKILIQIDSGDLGRDGLNHISSFISNNRESISPDFLIQSEKLLEEVTDIIESE